MNHGIHSGSIHTGKLTSSTPASRISTLIPYKSRPPTVFNTSRLDFATRRHDTAADLRSYCVAADAPSRFSLFSTIDGYAPVRMRRSGKQASAVDTERVDSTLSSCKKVYLRLCTHVCPSCRATPWRCLTTRKAFFCRISWDVERSRISVQITHSCVFDRVVCDDCLEGTNPQETSCCHIWQGPRKPRLKTMFPNLRPRMTMETNESTARPVESPTVRREVLGVHISYLSPASTRHHRSFRYAEGAGGDTPHLDGSPADNETTPQQRTYSGHH